VSTPKNEDLPNRLLSVGQAASYLAISRTALFRLRKAGEIPAVAITPGRYAFRLSDLDAFTASRTEQVRLPG